MMSDEKEVCTHDHRYITILVVCEPCRKTFGSALWNQYTFELRVCTVEEAISRLHPGETFDDDERNDQENIYREYFIYDRLPECPGCHKQMTWGILKTVPFMGGIQVGILSLDWSFTRISQARQWFYKKVILPYPDFDMHSFAEVHAENLN